MKIFYAFCVLLLSSPSIRAQDRTDSIYTRVDSAAQYPGGKAGWTKFLQKNLKYPQEAQDNEVHGVISVRFIVDKDGNVSDVTAISGPKELRPEGERMIILSKNWIPATVNSVAVKSYRIQEFTFKIDR